MNHHDHHDHHDQHDHQDQQISGLAWGYNNAGGLGVAGTATVLRPVGVRLPGHTIDVQGGSDFTVALTADGRVHTWGGNRWGQLADAPSRARFAAHPVSLPGHARITAISVGEDHVLALSDRGRVYSWGRNTYGQLGDGTREHRHTPQLLSVEQVTAISTGNHSSAAVTRSGAVYTWGHTAGSSGRVGVGAELLVTTPSPLTLPKGTRAVAADAGKRHLVVLTDRGRLLGYGVTPAGKPVRQTLRVDPALGRVVHISAGDNHTAALTSSGAVLAWGANDDGQLGHGSAAGTTEPSRVRVPRSGGRVVAVVAGGSSVLVRTEAHRVFSWGLGRWGQHGTGSTTNADRPVLVPIPESHRVTGIYAGRYHCFASTTH